MRQLVLQENILEKIKATPFLLAKIATVLKISTAYLLRLIRENDPRLTQASVLELIKTHLELPMNKILEKEVVAE